jgi:polar amino acid transport system substrate-binding protein
MESEEASMTLRGRAGLLICGLFLVSACAAPGASPTQVTPTGTPAAIATQTAAATATPNDHLARIHQAGKLVAFTDPAYPPQSSLNATTGEYEGFDIDVTHEIADRLGIETVEFATPDFDQMQAGSWAGRYDISVGSVTVTEARKSVLDFTQVYYYTPAQLATHPDSGITTVDAFAGKVICVGEGTTYFDWLEGTLTLTPEAGEVSEPPEGSTATTLRTDTDCAESWRAGRREFDGWLSAQPTVQQTVDADFPVVFVGDPVFFEPLAVVFDKSVPDNDRLISEVDRIIGEMHVDGTLTELSEKWYEGLDLTKQE